MIIYKNIKKEKGVFKITVEELDIIVQANVEQALKELKKLTPYIKQTIKNVEDNFNNVDVKGMTENIQKEINKVDTTKVKKEVEDLKKYTQQKIDVNLSSKEATEQISQIEIEIEKLKKKISTDTLQLNIVNNSISNMQENQKASVKTRFPSSNDTQVQDRAEYELYQNEANYSKLVEQANKLNQEISLNTSLLQSANSELLKMKENYSQVLQTQTQFDPNDTSGITIHLNGHEIAKEITGISKSIGTLKGKSADLKNAVELASYQNKLKGISDTAQVVEKDVSKIGNVKFANSATEILNKQLEQTKTTISGFRGTIGISPDTSTISLWDTLKTKIEQIKPAINQAKYAFQEMGKNPQLEEIKYKISEIQEKLQNVKDGKIKMSTDEIVKAESDLDKLRLKKAQIEQSGGSSPFYKWQPAIDKAKESISKVSGVINKISSGVKKVLSSLGKVVSTAGKLFAKVTGISKIMNNISSKTKNIGLGFKQGLKNVIGYAGALFSLRSIYNVLSSSASSWLSSQNSAAEQATTNIEYMKYAMGSAFAPVIEYVIDLFYQLLKAIQSVVYALTGLNIFANASASSYSDMADSASDTADSTKEATKSLAGVHDEINNVSESDSSSDSSSSSSSSPSYDLSTLDDEMSSFSEALYNFFEPLVESWKTYGAELVEQLKTTASQVMYLITSVWGSFENIITNGTVYYILENILAIIGNIAEAFANAWNYNGNGDIIIQNMADALNNLLIAIRNVTESTAFQTWLNELLSLFKDVSDVLASIDFQPIIDALFTLGSTISLIAVDVLLLVVDFLKKVAESSSTVTIINNVSTAFSNLWTAIKNVYYSDAFQTWLSNVGDKLATISQKLADTNWQPLIDAITKIGTSIGDIALTILDGLVTVFTWFVEHPDIATTLLAIGTALVVIGTAVKSLSSVAGTLSGIQKGIELITGSSVGFSTIISTIGGIVAVVVGAISSISSFITMLQEGFSWLNEIIMLVGIAITAIGAIILGAPALVAGIVAAVIAVIATVVVVVKEHWETIKTFFTETIPECFTQFIEWIQEKFEAIKTFFTEIVPGWFTQFGEFIKEKWEEIKENISTTIETIKTAISEKFEAIKEGITTTIENVKTAISDKFNAIKEGITTTIENIKTTVTDKFNSIKETISTIIENVKTTISTVWNTIKTTISIVINTISTTISTVWNTIKTTITTVITTIKEKISSIFNTIKSTISTIINSIKSTISTVWTSIKTKIVDTVTTIKDKVKSAFTTLKDNISTIFTKVKDKITDIWESIYNSIKTVINNILAGMETMLNGAIKMINKFLSGINSLSSSVGSLIGVSGTSLQLSEVSLPRLATGNVAYEETLGIFAEYAGASSNPEITAPQSILKETFSDVLSEYGENNNQSINLSVYVSNTKLGQILLDDLRSAKRRSGKDIEALVGN